MFDLLANETNRQCHITYDAEIAPRFALPAPILNRNSGIVFINPLTGPQSSGLDRFSALAPWEARQVTVM